MKAEIIDLKIKDTQAQSKRMVDKLFFCLMMPITFFIYCFIYLATAPISAWEKAYTFLSKDSNSAF